MSQFAALGAPYGTEHPRFSLFGRLGNLAMNKPLPAARYTKRLSDKILIAFHHACDQGDVQVASELLRVLDVVATRKPPLPTSEVRRPDRGLVGAHERLWQLRNPEDGGGAGMRLRKE
jgi:hypothetical protein